MPVTVEIAQLASPEMHGKNSSTTRSSAAFALPHHFRTTIALVGKRSCAFAHVKAWFTNTFSATVSGDAGDGARSCERRSRFAFT